MGLTPLVRPEGLVFLGILALTMFVLAPAQRLRTILFAFLALVPLIVHLLWRHSYYGEWLPNTYYLKATHFPLIDRLVHSQGRGAISRAADDLWESKFVAPKRQEVQIQLLEHENEHRARDAVFIMAELLQREAPIKRPVLDQRLRRLETSAEDPITRDAAGALRRSMRVHHGGL